MIVIPGFKFVLRRPKVALSRICTVYLCLIHKTLLETVPVFSWELKDKGEDFTIKWSVATKASPYICSSKRCDLCLTEKLLIAKADPRALLNKRSEIVSKCRYRNKFTLKRFH